MKAIVAITDERLIDNDRPDDEHLWRALMAESDLAIAVHKLEPSGDVRVVDVSARCAPFGIVNWNQAPGMLLKDIALPHIVNYVTPKLRQCIESGKPQSYERAIEFPSGCRGWSTNIFPLKGRKGTTCYAVAVHRPIREFAVEQTLPEVRQDNDGPAFVAPDLIYIFNAKDRKVTFAVGSLKELIGLNLQQLEKFAEPASSLAHPEDLKVLQATLDEIGTKGVAPPDTFECRVRHADGKYHRLVFHCKVLEMSDDGGWHLMGIASNANDRSQLEREVLHLHQELACMQLKERRLIAQELHDSAGQQIIAAKLALALANEYASIPESNEPLQSALRDVRSCLDSADREIRSLSYILHPPAIIGKKLATVLTNFAMGYGGRAGLRMDVSIDTRINEYQAKLAIPLLRIFQEALSNVHRHAKATSVLVHLDVIDDIIELKIFDDGIGISNVRGSRTQPQGLGLTCMRERIEELGGKLVVKGSQGSRLKATIPLP
jgi:signal transduction histidine kinase